jgi:hypothetical protein
MQASGRRADSSLFEVFISLAYSDKVDAENYMKDLIKQALEQGGKIYLEDGDYTTVSGKIFLKPTGMTSYRSNNYYKIGVETEATKLSILSLKAKASVPIYKITDGLAYEVRIEELKNRKIEELRARQDEVANNLKKFEAEIRPMTDLYPVLRSFVRYSNQRTDKEKLAAIAIKKIQKLV